MNSRVQNEYLKSKIMSAEKACELIPNGASVGFSGFVGAGCALALPQALAQRATALHEKGEPHQIEIFTGASTDPLLDGVLAKAGAVSFRAPFFTDADMRRAINSGAVRYADVHLSSLAAQLKAGFFPHLDFAVIEVVAIKESGELVPSTSLGNNQAWLDIADRVILEVNYYQPLELEGIHDVTDLRLPPYATDLPIKHVGDRVGSPYMHVDPAKVVAVIEARTHDRVNNFTAVDEISSAIGRNVVKFLKNEEACGRLPAKKLLPLQSGIGNVANAVLSSLQDDGYQGLQCYSEVIQDGMLDLIKRGVVGTASATALSLSPAGVEEFQKNIDFYRKHIILRSQDVSNSPALIRRLGVVSMNGMLEADIYGNVNSTNVMGSQMKNGIGGSGDFARNGYLSLFLSPSLAKGGAISAIVPFVSHVDHTEHDTQVIITEYGIADLRGKCPRERARTMISIAHPTYQDALRDYFERACAQPCAGHTPHILSEALSWHQRFKDTGSMKA